MKAIYNCLLKTLVLAFLLGGTLASSAWAEKASNTAKVKLYGTATHIIGERVWTVVGTYNIPIVRTGEGWKLSGIQFLYKYQTGAIDLTAEAKHRIELICVY